MSAVDTFTVGVGEPFASIAELSETHSTFLRQLHGSDKHLTPELLAAITHFIRRGQATGALLDDPSDRHAAQSMLDYWVTVLFRADQEPPESTLADFDSKLVHTLGDELCPYRGLEAFRERDRHLFFGRQRIVVELIERLRGKRLLAIIGRSGSGKSSLVLGGLIPALKNGALPGSQSWRYLPPLMPSEHPLRSLASALVPDNADREARVLEQIERMRQDQRQLARLLSKRDLPRALTERWAARDMPSAAAPSSATRRSAMKISRLPGASCSSWCGRGIAWMRPAGALRSAMASRRPVAASGGMSCIARARTPSMSMMCSVN
jgi:hypothetical protein